MSTHTTFQCRTCGELHDMNEISFGFVLPETCAGLSEEELNQKCEYTSDYCKCDNGEGTDYFIRGCIEIPIVGSEEPFVWGVWTSLSEQNFNRSVTLVEVEGRESEPPYFGWLMSRVTLYPNTMELKTMVHTRKVGQRPYVELEPTDHPLAVEQRKGISMERVQEIVETLLHDKA